MAKSKQVIAAIVLGAICLVAGRLATSLVLGAAMFQALPVMLAWSLLILALGAGLCGYAAFRLPLLWLLWPLLFGIDMFVFGMFAGFSPPNPGGVLLWRALGAAFIVVPALSSLYGRTRKHRLAESQ